MYVAQMEECCYRVVKLEVSCLLELLQQSAAFPSHQWYSILLLRYLIKRRASDVSAHSCLPVTLSSVFLEEIVEHRRLSVVFAASFLQSA
jgi:hypothetical protein